MGGSGTSPDWGTRWGFRIKWACILGLVTVAPVALVADLAAGVLTILVLGLGLLFAANLRRQAELAERVAELEG